MVRENKAFLFPYFFYKKGIGGGWGRREQHRESKQLEKFNGLSLAENKRYV